MEVNSGSTCLIEVATSTLSTFAIYYSELLLMALFLRLGLHGCPWLLMWKLKSVDAVWESISSNIFF
jgi:hypothetical protein